MSVDALVATFLVGIFVTGYSVGRARPVRRVIEWNWLRVIYSRRANWADVALFAIFNPGRAWHVWRTRNDPPLTYTVPTVHPRWAAPIPDPTFDNPITVHGIPAEDHHAHVCPACRRVREEKP